MKYSSRFTPRFVRDFVLALIVVAGMYAFAFSPVWPLQLPGYLLIVGFDVLERTFGPALGLGVTFDVAFALYLVVLALLGTAVAGGIRARLGDGGWTDGVAAALVVLGVLVLSLVASAFAFVQGGASFVPLATITATGIVLVGLGWATALAVRNYRLTISLSKQSE